MHEGHWNWKDVSAIARFELGPSLVEQQQRQQSHAELAELLTLTSKSGRCRPEVNNQRTICSAHPAVPRKLSNQERDATANRPELAGLA